ncbi:PREDICTED: cysteine and histidine-rich protein 1 isoform X3 [Hipposideros armiger]|uniref:Zinc finger TRAF-type-containing protein 1 n=1 Tax=Hipposideros armiger TaxID=186990 RepID=A0A8B7QCL1_HIPAR|nr:PREDICTED: cysteine and histidine-rich protein 1 isoform X3 [Hipposideros armiger]
MSGVEEAGGGGPATGPPGAVPAGAGAAAGSAAALGEAAGPGIPDEAGLAGARQLQEAAGDPDAPPKKRLRAAEAAEAAAGSGKLEERLYSVLCCTVCLDLPKASVYQCTNGHLMCAGCFIHLLADARLKEEQATCPNCRCEISKSLCCRNLAVEKAVSELPSECGFCLRQFPRSLLERHQKEECQDRVTQCKYKRIGCPWHGPFHELTVHEAACAHPTKTGNELMEILGEMDQSLRKEMQLYNSIFSLLSFEKIGYTGVHRSGQRPHEASKKMLRARAPEQAEQAQLKRQSWEWSTLRPTGSHGLSWPLRLPSDMLGTSSQARAWSRCEHQEVPTDAGAAQGDLRPSAAHPRRVAGPEHQWRSLAASHTTLPGWDLARCGPSQA